jgi:predicted amidohydrolase YtcJ
MTPSLVLFNARVLTMDPTLPRASALAVAGDTILAVGGDDLRALAGPATRLIDAGGATVLPGFVESHVHLFSGAYGMTLMQMAGVRGIDALRATP